MLDTASGCRSISQNLRDDQVQPVGLVELGDLLLEAEVLDDLAGPGGETLDVVGQVGGDVVGVALELLEGEAAGVVERHAGDAVEDRLEVLDLAVLETPELGQHLVLGRLQHTVQPPQDRQRQHDILVLVRSYGPRSRSATDQMKLTFSPKLFIRHYLPFIASAGATEKPDLQTPVATSIFWRSGRSRRSALMTVLSPRLSTMTGNFSAMSRPLYPVTAPGLG